jgi:hypothetical protein
MSKNIYILILMLALPVPLQAASWMETCPQVEVESPFQYKRIWTTDNEWVKKPISANQPILMSCGNWKVMGQEMVCYYGGYKTTYDYSVKKNIPDGANCQRSGQCQFKCTSQTMPQKLAPKLKAPMQVVPR